MCVFFDYVYIILLCMMSVARVIMDAEGWGAPEIKGKRKKAQPRGRKTRGRMCMLSNGKEKLLSKSCTINYI